jgi:transposase
MSAATPPDTTSLPLTGTATHPRIVGRTVRHRLNRGGNRQLNRALYTIAITQIRADTEGRAYHQRKRAEGKPAAKPSAASKDGCLT